MNKKIIDSHRYKKVSRSKLKKHNVKDVKKGSKIVKTNLSKKKRKYKHYSFSKVVVCCIALAMIVILSKFMLNSKNLNIISVFSNNDANTDETLEENYNFNIGISKLDTTDYLNSSNIILNELVKKSKLSLVKINNEYKKEFYLAESIDKLSDLSYKIILNPIYKSDVDAVISSFNKIKSIGSTNIYYKNLENMVKAEKIDDTSLKISLASPDPFFVYKLNFPIYDSNNKDTEYIMNDVTSTSVHFAKNNSKSSIGVMKLSSYSNTDEMVSAFRDDNIDMFTASSDSIMQLIGKKEYNIKKYRDGEAIFLFGNTSSPLFKRKEVRQAIAYAINREEIVKDVDMKFSEVIDIPYIYSDVKYKYDLYAAENGLVLSGWKKTGGIYTKNEGYEYNKLELNLLVNEADQNKVKIADHIKEMVEKVGIRINVLRLPETELVNKVTEGQYDLVLSTVNINENPNIEYLYSYINVSDIVNSAIEGVKNSDISNIEENVTNLKNTLSSEVACIGIMARTTNIVYQKDIKGFDNIQYMKIFDNIENIGKVK